MEILINTEGNIEGNEELIARVKDVVEGSLSKFSEQITEIGVHLSDQNGDESGSDTKRCLLEARLEGRRPTFASHQASSVDAAVDGAADKMRRIIESTMARLRDVRRT